MNHCPVLVPPIGNAIGDLASTLTLARSARRIPQFEVAIGDAAGALVVRALDPLPVEDETLFLEFGKKLDLDVYVQTGGPGTVRPLAQARTLFYSLDEFDVRIEFAPTDFIQVNAFINRLMVKEAVDVSGIDATDNVLDLFCGVGNFSLPFARKAARVVGVEGDAGLVARAAKNAELNKLNNCRFITADLMQGGWSVLREPWDVVVLDPPRSGAAALGSDWAAMSPRRIVYVSCHPATLARDAKVLSEEHGYVMSTARVFDMFPNTHHAEVMAVFDRL
jgi:23S rRNA (uracil1939-C5)-methyltransferase